MNDCVLDLNNRNGYNNQLTVGSRNQHFGINDINLNEIKKTPLMVGKQSVIRRISAIAPAKLLKVNMRSHLL